VQFDEYSCDISHGFNRDSASRGPSTTAELHVDFGAVSYYLLISYVSLLILFFFAFSLLISSLT